MSVTSEPIVLINGATDVSAAAIHPIMNRAFQYADGLFETMRVENAQVPLIAFHLERLQAGCRRLGLVLDDSFRAQQELFLGMLPNNCVGIARITVFRANGGRGNYTGDSASADIVLQFTATSEIQQGSWLQPPCDLLPAAIRLYPNPNLAGLKHLNRLDYALATRGFSSSETTEALLLDPDEYVVETPHHNIFAVSGGRLLTPSLEKSGVRGVMRRVLLAAAEAAGFRDVAVKPIHFTELLTADEIFLCNALRGLVPVRECAGRSFPPASNSVVTKLSQAVYDFTQE